MAAGVSIVTDLPFSMSGSQRGEISAEMETGTRALQHENNTSALLFKKKKFSLA